MTEAAQGAMFPKRQSYFFMLIVDEIVLREQSFVPSPCDVRFLLYKGICGDMQGLRSLIRQRSQHRLTSASLTRDA